MEVVTPIHAEIAELKSININKSPKESPDSKEFPSFITDLQSLVTRAQTIWLRYENEKRISCSEIKSLKTKCSQLRNIINTLKSKPCDQCLQLQSVIQQKEQEIKRRDDLLMSIMKNGLAKNHHSYSVFSQMVHDTVGGYDTAELMDSGDPVVLESENEKLPPALENKEENFPENDIKSKVSPGDERKNETEVSPVVLKRSRSSKRRIMCISSKKKNKLENGDSISDDDLDLDFPQLTVVNVNNAANVGTTQTPENVRDCITALNPDNEADKNFLEQSPEVLNETIRNYVIRDLRTLEEPSPEVLNRSTDVRKSLNFESDLPKPNDSFENCMVDKSSKNSNIKITSCPEDFTQKTAEKPLNSLNVNVINNFSGVPANKNENPNVDEKSKKIKWDLKKSREPTNNKKLKQTLLSTAAFEKKLDISTLEDYKGGLLPSEVKPSNTEKHTGKENFNETFFEPLVTSTSNDVSMAKQKTPVKEQNIVDNSFDVIPSTSPNYKYRRDAVRKKSERRKLPGQDCTKCFNFYMQKRDDFGETQAKKLLNKCSRHRDKFAIVANTPPGFWNPVFDTDEEMDK